MRILALDVGDRKIGLATSDELEILATPYGIIKRTSKAEDFAKIIRIVNIKQIDIIVVGIPKYPDGALSPQAKKIMRYSEQMAVAIKRDVLFFDESYSTAEAQSLLAEAGHKHQFPLDAAAAAVILRDFLDERRMQTTAKVEINDADNHSKGVESID